MATTAKKGSSKIFWIIGGLIVIAGGVGAYFLLRKPKEEKNETDTDTDTDDKSVDTNTGGGTSVSSYPKAPAELDTTDKIKAFQDWMDAQGKGWIKKDGKWVLLNKGAGYGNYGKSTDAVWKVYGKQYLESIKSGTSVKPSSSSSSTSQLDKDIETIIKSATGTKAEKSYLQKTNTDFVSNWAKSIRNDKRAFIWANQVYRTKTGEKILEYNPINVRFYANISGAIAKTSASNSASAYAVVKGTDLGRASGIDYNNGLWLYLPEKGSIYKWYKINNISRTKTSNFEGVTDEIEFLNFDNNLDLNL
jgi:hypothetical protein